MRIAFTGFHLPSPSEVDVGPRIFLQRQAARHTFARRLAARGHEVHAIHLFDRDETLDHDGVRHHFRAAGTFAGTSGRLLAALTHRPPAAWTPAWRPLRTLREIAPEIVHFHGATLYLNLALTARGWPAKPPPIVVHHHGGQLSGRALVRRLQARAMRAAAALLVTAPAHADGYRAAGALVDTRIVPFMEMSSPFRLRDRAAARRRTGIFGQPVVLSAARLHPLKAPDVVLRGFAQVVERWPDARLYHYYRTAEMIDDLAKIVADDPRLRDRVVFAGTLEHTAMEDVYNSADILVQASRREWSGVAVLDAMACGVVPVLSRIPSFVEMTGGGAVGELFEVDDAEDLARALGQVDLERLPDLSGAVHQRFASRYRYERLTDQLETLYASIVQ